VIARLGGVALSVLLHAGLIALLLVWSAVDWTEPLFVDLVEPEEASGRSAAVPAPSPRPAARTTGAAPATSHTAARPAPVAAPGSPAPAPAPSPAVADGAAPGADAAPPSPSAPALAVEPPAAAPGPVVSPAPPAPVEGRGPVSGGGAASSGAQRRDDADRGAGGGPGAPVALATPGPGGAGAAPAEYGAYLRQFRQRVQESIVYPLAARRRGLGGTVELHVWLEATGRVRDVQVARSSSHGVLDDAALETIRRLGPVPFPESLPRRPLLIRLPLVYELR
jgi:protein TonB